MNDQTYNRRAAIVVAVCLTFLALIGILKAAGIL